jgi:seryl-tRNA synthetase
VLQPEKGGDPSIVRESQKKRGAPEEIVEEVLRLYKEWTVLDFKLNGLQKESNAVQKEITAKRKAKENADDLMTKKAGVDKQVGELKPQVTEAEAKMRTKAGEIGNIVGDKVPMSQTEVCT